MDSCWLMHKWYGKHNYNERRGALLTIVCRILMGKHPKNIRKASEKHSENDYINKN